MKAHFRMFAGYNRWANAWLYEAAFALPEDAYRRNVGLYFGSIHSTLNHLLHTDRMWMGRIDRSEEVPGPLDVIVHEDRRDLLRARIAADERLIALIDSFPPDGFEQHLSYRNTAGASFSEPLSQILVHLLNHQTHHRSQGHSALSILGNEPPALDLVLFQRGIPAPDLAALLENS